MTPTAALLLDAAVKSTLLLLWGLGVTALLRNRVSAALRHSILLCTLLATLAVPFIGPLLPTGNAVTYKPAPPPQETPVMPALSATPRSPRRRNRQGRCHYLIPPCPDSDNPARPVPVARGTDWSVCAGAGSGCGAGRGRPRNGRAAYPAECRPAAGKHCCRNLCRCPGCPFRDAASRRGTRLPGPGHAADVGLAPSDCSASGPRRDVARRASARRPAPRNRAYRPPRLARADFDAACLRRLLVPPACLACRRPPSRNRRTSL